MKSYWIAVIVATGLTVGAVAQTGASGSASTNTSVTTGQTGAQANTNASGNAQVSGGSASANTDANANVKAEGSKKSSKNQKGNTSADASAGSASGAAANAGGATLSNGTVLQAELTKSLDAKKAKSGDEVTAKATQDIKSNGQVVVRKGSKLIGHVTEAQARSKDNAESKLGIVFDHAVLKDGSQVNFNAVVQALAPAEPPPTAMSSAPADRGADDMAVGGGSAGASRPAPMGG